MHEETSVGDAAVSKEDLTALIERMRGKRVMIVGDVMLDHYTLGTVTRISPEAPVPVVRVKEELYRLGGAGNVARNIVALGGAATMLGVAGKDPDGDTLEAMLRAADVDAALARDEHRRTTRKTRIIAQNQQIVRIDREETDPLPGPLLDRLLDLLRRQIERHDVIIVSDYGKGVITGQVMDALRTFRDGHAGGKILVDPKPGNYDLYRDVDILTPNALEAAQGAGLPCCDGGEQGAIAEALFQRLGCRSLLITLGARGMELYPTPERSLRIPTFAQTVFDVTGAGDTVIAALALALAAGASLPQAAMLANHAAGIVVAQVGAAAPSPAELRAAVAKRCEANAHTVRANGDAKGVPGGEGTRNVSGEKRDEASLAPAPLQPKVVK